MLCMGANLAFDLGRTAIFYALGDLSLALPFAVIGVYTLMGLLRGRALRLCWFVQAGLKLLVWHEATGDSNSTAVRSLRWRVVSP